jgi:hypothetical protein
VIRRLVSDYVDDLTGAISYISYQRFSQIHSSDKTLFLYLNGFRPISLTHDLQFVVGQRIRISSFGIELRQYTYQISNGQGQELFAFHTIKMRMASLARTFILAPR